jgi:hypothetical protein
MLRPDPSHSYLFPTTKRLLNGCKFQSADEMNECMISTEQAYRVFAAAALIQLLEELLSK